MCMTPFGLILKLCRKRAPPPHADQHIGGLVDRKLLFVRNSIAIFELKLILENSFLPDKIGWWEAKFIMDGISKKLIKDGIHSTIRVIFLALVSF